MSGSILVTGGAGFIGSNVVHGLVASGEKVVVADNLCTGKRENVSDIDVEFVSCDAGDPSALRTVLRNHHISTVINTTTRSLPYCLKYPYDGVAQTIGVIRALCEEQRTGGFERLIHFSSSEVYGLVQSFPIVESHPLNPATPYAAAKAACDHIVLAYVRTFGTHAHILRPFNQFGPREQRGEFAAIISRVIDAVLAGSEIVVFGNGAQTRDFLYVDNLLPAVRTLFHMPDIANGDVIQISSSEERSILEVIETVFRIMGRTVPVRHKSDRPADVMKQQASRTKAKEVLSWEPSVSFEEGIERTVRWHRDNPL